MSLFPDDYPNSEPAPTWTPTVHCCERWTDFVRDVNPDPDRVWVVVHEFAHSRTPFSVDALGAYSETPNRVAADAIVAAVKAGWITPAPAERYQGVAMTHTWQGLLPRHR